MPGIETPLIGLMALALSGVLAVPVAAEDVARTSDPEVSRISLDEAVRAADSENIDVLRSRLSVRNAEASLRIADTAPNPNLNLSAVQIRPNLIGVQPAGQLADTIVSVDMLLERGGKRRARTAAAAALVAAAKASLAATRRDIREAIYGSYFDLKAAEQKVELLRSVAASYGESSRLAELKFRAGALSGGDLARQRVESSRAQTDLQVAEADLQAAQLDLAILIGREGSFTRLATSSDWPGGAVAENAVAPDLLAMERPEVRAAQSGVTAAARSLDAAKALRKQDVTVSVQFERAPASLGVGSSVGFGLSVPLMVRNHYRGDIDAAGTQLVAAEAELRKALSVATADIAIARNAYRQAARRLGVIELEQLPAAQNAAQVAEFAYANGAISLLELLDARRSLRAVELDAIDARNAEARAIARLNAAESVGGDE